MNLWNFFDWNWMLLLDIYFICIIWGVNNICKLFVILFVVDILLFWLCIFNNEKYGLNVFGIWSIIVFYVKVIVVFSVKWIMWKFLK